MSALSRSFSHCRLRRRCNAPAVEVLEYRTLLSAAAIGVTAVEAADSPPQPMVDQYRTPVDRTLAGNVLANDTDPDGDPLIVTAVNGDTSAVGQMVTLPSGAQLTVNADGTFIYEPDNAFPGLAAGEEARDGFSYFVTDEPASGRDWSAQALITVFWSGDGRSLIGFNSGGWYVGVSDGASFETTPWAGWSDAGWDHLRHGDFNGDGRTDVLGLIDGTSSLAFQPVPVSPPRCGPLGRTLIGEMCSLAIWISTVATMCLSASATVASGGERCRPARASARPACG